MASNVAGSPVTNEMLRGLPQYSGINQPTLTPLDRARVAMQMKNEEGKDVKARKMAEYICDQRYKGTVATMGLLYNATGGPLRLVRDYTWNGHLCESPYPNIIQNGQWGVFVHGSSSDYSKAAVVYSGEDNQGYQHHWCLVWANNFLGPGDENRLYVEVRGVGHYTDDMSDALRQAVDLDGKVKRKLIMEELTTSTHIMGSFGDDVVAVLECVMTLPNVFTQV